MSVLPDPIAWRPLNTAHGIIGTGGGTIWRVQMRGDHYAAYRIDRIGGPVRLIACGTFDYCKRVCEHIVHTREAQEAQA